ncbi:MAG: elongation factor P [Bryobacterales bacterium]|nr:elongation factor P [Bryobacterales bacterium]
MVLASQLRTGMAIRYEGEPYRVIAAEYHPGQGKMGGVCHARLQSIRTGTQWEHSFRSEVKLETLTVERRAAEFVYRDGEDYVFMDTETFEQVALPERIIGPNAAFLAPQMHLAMEFVDGDPIGVAIPDVLEVTIVDTAPVSHGSDNVWKPATLENGVDVMVPPFVKIGDAIRLDVTTRRYMDRAKASVH